VVGWESIAGYLKATDVGIEQKGGDTNETWANVNSTTVSIVMLTVLLFVPSLAPRA
jgi:hypothetical protein